MYHSEEPVENNTVLRSSPNFYKNRNRKLTSNNCLIKKRSKQLIIDAKRKDQLYRYVCDLKNDLNLHHTILYFAFECVKILEKQSFEYDNKKVSVWTECLKECMDHNELNFLFTLPNDDLLRLCWLVCIFNHLSFDDLEFNFLTPSWYKGDDKSYIWEFKLNRCFLSKAGSANETLKLLEYKLSANISCS